MIIGICAVPERYDHAAQLRLDTGADFICTDLEHKGERWCHQQALSWAMEDTDDSWIILLEDDAIACDNFRDELETALKGHSGIVSLYLGTGRWAGESFTRHAPVIDELTARADADGASVIIAPALWHAVGIAIPRQSALNLWKWLASDPAATDQAITHWVKANNHTVTYLWPSLVDHRDEARAVDKPEADVPRHAIRFKGKGNHERDSRDTQTVR